LLRDQSGATAIEYGLIIALIFLVMIGGVSSFGTRATNVLITASNAVGGAM
jgi:pilus assembly protein Flp/PilA